MRVDLFIARRLRLSDGQGNRSKVSVRISTVGVLLSVAIMLLSLAVTSGFKKEIQNKITGFDGQLTVELQQADVTAASQPIEDMADVMSLIGRTIGDAKAEPVTKLPGMLKTDDTFAAVLFCGYGGDTHTEFIKGNITEGEMPDLEVNANAVAISSAVAAQLGLKTGDKINACFFTGEKMRLRNFEVAAIYSSGFQEYDKVVAYAPIATLNKIAGIPEDCASSIEINGLELDALPYAQAALSRELSNGFYSGALQQYLSVVSILESGAMYFNWLSLLDTNVAVIMILMTAIAMFTLTASLIILILERVNMIGTLKMLGATNAMIRRIFIMLDMKVLARGLLAGNAIALGLIFMQDKLRLMPLDPESYYISFVPVEITASTVALLNVGFVAVAVAVVIVPSLIITRLRPASILRYE